MNSENLTADYKIEEEEKMNTAVIKNPKENGAEITPKPEKIIKEEDSDIEEISIEADEEDNDIEEIVIEADEEEISNVVKLSKKYKFEGKIIDTVDLTGIERMSGETAQNVERLYRKITKNISSAPEITVDYAIAAASILTGLPAEFFKRINIKDLTRMKSRIVNFLYGE